MHSTTPLGKKHLLGGKPCEASRSSSSHAGSKTTLWVENLAWGVLSSGIWGGWVAMGVMVSGVGCRLVFGVLSLCIQFLVMSC